MLHTRNRPFDRIALGSLLVLIVASGCSPDAPDGGLPTHPTDTYSVTLEWDAPTEDAVGQPLTDLAGYRLYYSDSDDPQAGNSTMVELADTTRVTVSDLPAGVYVFAVTALDADGNESALSDPLSVEVGP